MDIRAQRTMKMLIEAFEEISAEKPLQDISVSEICKRSTVRRGTFYRHFDDKNAFYSYYLNTLTEHFLKEVEEGRNLDDLWEYASYMNLSLARYVDSNMALSRSISENKLLVSTTDMMVAQIADGIISRIKTYCETNSISLEASPEFIGAFYSSGVMHMLRWWISEGKPFSAEELEKNCTAFLRRYLDA